MLNKHLLFGVALATTTAAMADTPAPALIGAQRVVLACEFAGDLHKADESGLCQQLLKKARRYTDLPVSLATSADLSLGRNMRQQADQLLLRVRGEARDAGDGRKSLALEVTPVRLARPMGRMAPLKSSASLVRVQDGWTLQGPIDAFAKLLGGSKRLRSPAVLDS